MHFELYLETLMGNGRLKYQNVYEYVGFEHLMAANVEITVIWESNAV
jgi:hypothetical protein